MISSLGLEHRVHHLSKVSEEDKNALIAHCHGYIHPSIAEGFGIPPIEAMLYGRPVFLSKETSLPEIGGSQAYYFDALEPKAMAVCVRQGLQDFHQDPTKPQKLKDWASQYNYTRMASQYYALYQELLQQP